MADVLTLPYKKTFVLIEMRHGPLTGETFHRYTNFTSNPGVFGVTWTPVPAIKVDASADTGAFSEEIFTIDIPADDFIPTFSDFQPHEMVRITVWIGWQTEDASDDVDPVVIFKGRLRKVIRGINATQEMLQLECVNWKSGVARKLGINAALHCQWTFGHPKTCGFNVLAEVEPGTITDIDGTTLTITGLTRGTGGPNANEFFYHRGYLLDGDLKITIREWNDSAPTIFELVKPPPTSWDTGTYVVDVYPGCYKAIEQCRLWNREARFSGYGYGLPSYDPRIDNPY